MAIQPLEDNHQYLTKIKKIFFFIKSKLYFKDMKIKYLFLNMLNGKIVQVGIYICSTCVSTHYFITNVLSVVI